VEQALRLGKTAEKIGGVDAIEGTEIGAEAHGISGFEMDAISFIALGQSDYEVGGDVGFFKTLAREGLSRSQVLCGFDERTGKVDADHLAAGRDISKLERPTAQPRSSPRATS
jgi:hypothetical protein